MDKIGWNEQWMGYPLDDRYGKSSNVDNAGKLQGQLLLIVGELDMNVDPASTMQVVNALIKANKMFDLLVIPGGGHGAGRTNGPVEYGTRRQLRLLRASPAGRRDAGLEPDADRGNAVELVPGGFAPRSPPTGSLAGAPTPRAARQAHSLPLVRAICEITSSLVPTGFAPRRELAQDLVASTSGLSKTAIAGAKSPERGTVCRHDISIDRVGGGDEPRVVLAQAPGCPALDQSAPPRLREVQSLNREALQRGQRGAWSAAPSRSSSTLTTDTTIRRPRSVGRNRRAGPSSPAAVSRSRSIK